MGSWIIEFISNIVDITGNALVDTIIFAVIGIISGSVAFGLVGSLSNLTGKYNSRSMSAMHWGFRVIIFVILTFVLVKIAEVIRFVFTPPALYYLIGFAIVVVIIIVFILIFKKPTEVKVEEKIRVIENEEPTFAENAIKESNENNKYKCPYCGELLVERKGPYGKFIGCSNYPECKYTRKEL